MMSYLCILYASFLVGAEVMTIMMMKSSRIKLSTGPGSPLRRYRYQSEAHALRSPCPNIYQILSPIKSLVSNISYTLPQVVRKSSAFDTYAYLHRIEGQCANESTTS